MDWVVVVGKHNGGIIVINSAVLEFAIGCKGGRPNGMVIIVKGGDHRSSWIQLWNGTR